METTETYYRVYVDGEILCRCDTVGKARETVDYMLAYYEGTAPCHASIRKVTITTTEEEV